MKYPSLFKTVFTTTTGYHGSRPHLDIRGSIKGRKRGEALAKKILRAAAAAGAELRVDEPAHGGEYKPCYLEYLGERIEFCITERSTRKFSYDYASNRRTYVETPTGELTFGFVNTGQSCVDKPNKKLEDRIDDIVAKLPQAAESAKAHRLKREEEKRKSDESAAAYKHHQEGVGAGDDNRDNLIKSLRMWQRARELTEYLDVIEAKFSGSGDVFNRWIGLARKIVADIDPLENGKKPWEELKMWNDGEKDLIIMSFEGLHPHEEFKHLAAAFRDRMGVYYGKY